MPQPSVGWGGGLYCDFASRPHFTWLCIRHRGASVAFNLQTASLIRVSISLPARIAVFVRLVVAALGRHPRRVTAVVGALLLGIGGGALALATLAPDVSDMPVRQLVQTLEISPDPLPVAPTTLHLVRNDLSRSSDNAGSLLQRLGVADADAIAFLSRDPMVRQYLLGRAGRAVGVEVDAGHRLLRLVARWAPDNLEGQFRRLVVQRDSDGQWRAELQASALQASARLASGTIESSLFAATDEAHVPDSVATQMAEIFSGDIDFHRALRQGDTFAVEYEVLQGDGEPLRAGRVLAASFTNRGKRFEAVWFRDPLGDGRGGYYTPDGQSLRRAYLASPLAFSRITSGFAMRMHPILQKMRAHQGVDYGAPTGTPVRVVGDGVVEFAGRQNGYGNVVIVRHGNQHSTVYAHLSKIGVHRGERVSQGQTLGAVGATGWATGPHLHFEFRVAGVYRDPQQIARTRETIPLTAASRPAFLQSAGQSQVALNAAATIGAADID